MSNKFEKGEKVRIVNYKEGVNGNFGKVVNNKPNGIERYEVEYTDDVGNYQLFHIPEKKLRKVNE